MFLFQTRANHPALRIKEPKLETDNARAVLRVYRLTPKEKALCRKKLDELDGFLIYKGGLTTREWLKSEIEPIIEDKVKYGYLHEFLNGTLGKMIKRKAIYPELLDGFVRFVGKVNKNGIEYSELMKNTLKGVNDAGSIAAPAIVRQGEGRFVTPESKVDGLYTAGAYDCTIAVTVCRGARGDVIRVGMAHIDPMMPEKEVEKFFFLSAIGGTVEAYMFGGNYPLKEVDGKPRKDIDEIASGVKGVAVKFYSRDFGAGFFAEDDAAYVDKHGGLYYGHVPRLDNSEKIGKQDKKRYRSLVLSHQAPISIFYE